MFRVCGSSKLLDRKRQYCASCVALFEYRYFTYELVDPMTDEEFAEREKLDEQLMSGIYGEVGGVFLIMPDANESHKALIGA